MAITVAKEQGSTNGRKTGPAKEAEAQLHSRLLSYFESELRRQAHNRYQMALDEDYYDSIQWLPHEAAEVTARGQNPVCYNETKPMIDWLIGVERRTRTDFRIIAASDDSPEASEDATCKTKLLKYIAEANRVEFERSSAADDCFKAGLGWIEVGVSPDPEDEPIFVRSESWRNMLYDSLGPRRDLQDSRYVIRFRVIDLDLATAYFPDKKQQLEASCAGMDTERYMEWWNGAPIDDYELPISMPGKYSMYDSDSWAKNERKRVLIIEVWHKEPTRETAKSGGPAGVDRVRMKMRCTVMTEKHILLDVESPYKHNRFPFIPVWCYRRKKDNAPYGAIRAIRGPQDALNKRMSKALFVLSTNRVIIEEGAINPKLMSAEEVRDEFQAPDGFIQLATGGIDKVKTERDNDIAQGHMQLAQVDQAMIRNASGISDENLNRTTSVQSGVALKQKAEQGGQLTAEIFDNQLFARQLEGELTLSLTEQYYTEAKVFSISGDRKKRDYVKINQPQPDGSTLNDITARKAQFIVGEQAWKQSLQQAAFESLMELMTNLAPTAPQIVMALLDTVFELADIPNKRVVLERIRSVTGQSDPDEKLTPEQQAQAAQTKAIANKKVEAELAQLDATIRESQAKGENLDAAALKTRIEALYVAMQAAGVVTQVPQTAAVADELLLSVGFKDQHPTAQPVAPAQPAMAPEMQQPQDGNPTLPNPMLSEGAATGIETPATNDGLQPGAI